MLKSLAVVAGSYTLSIVLVVASDQLLPSRDGRIHKAC